MNIQKVFEALEEDSGNSALGVICMELESQGYEVSIEGVSVTSNGIFEGEFSNLEQKLEPLRISLNRSGTLEQEFSIEFVDFHEFILKKTP